MISAQIKAIFGHCFGDVDFETRLVASDGVIAELIFNHFDIRRDVAIELPNRVVNNMLGWIFRQRTNRSTDLTTFRQTSTT